MPKSTDRSTTGEQTGAAANPFGAPFDFLKTLWGGMQVPGVMAPPLAPDDLKKQIADLKAVEAWLTLNMNILRTTIQTLEVQAATLAALSAMQQSMYAASQSGKDGGGAPASNFNPFFAPPFSGKSPSGEAANAGANDGGARSGQGKHATGASDNLTLPSFGDPNAWWALLQDQFKQTVDAALQQQAVMSTPPSSGGADKGKSDKDGPVKADAGNDNESRENESRSERKRDSAAAPKGAQKRGPQSE